MKNIRFIILIYALLSLSIYSAEIPSIDLCKFENDHTKVFKAPDSPMYPLMKEVIDPVFKTHITRVSDAPDKKKIRQEYSELQPWNADGTKIMMSGDIYDASMYKLIKDLPYMGGLKWSTVDPDVLFFTDGKDFKKHTLSTGKTEIIYTFPERINRGSSYQEISNDGTRAVVVTRPDNKPMIYSLDIGKNKILGKMEYARSIDWAGISPSGKYVVINTGSKGGRKLERNRGIEGFDVEMNYKGKIWTGRPHSDMIMDKDGNEWWIGYSFDDYAWGLKPSIVKSRIPDGCTRKVNGDKEGWIQLIELNWGHGGHISCRNIKNPSFCVVGAQGKPEDKPFSEEIYLLDLKSTIQKPLVARIAHHHSSRNKCPEGSLKYWCETHASINQEGTKVIFASNWVTGTKVDAFVIDLTKYCKK